MSHPIELSEPTPRKEYDVKIAFATHALMGYPRRALVGNTPDAQKASNLMAWLEHHGFDGMEVGQWWLDFSLLGADRVGAFKEELAAHNLELIAFNCLRKCVTHPKIADENERDLRRTIDVAKAVRPKYVSISFSLDADVYGVSQDKARGLPESFGCSKGAPERDYEITAALLKDLAREAAKADVEIAIEMHHCSLADNSRALLHLIDLADEPNISANPDLGNVLWGYEVPEEPWYESVKRVAGRVKFWHLKNVQRIHVPEVRHSFYVHAGLGEGDIDYRWALGTLMAAGFDGDVSIEGSGGGDFLAFADRGKKYLDELMDDIESGAGLVVM